MSYIDKELKCVEDNAPFIFSAGEQEVYEGKGFTPPKRCEKHRAIKRRRIEEQENKIHSPFSPRNWNKDK